MNLAETIDRIFGRVEVVLAGAEGALRDGQEALARGDGLAARRQAHALLSRVPGSPLGLALLADACESAGLDAELALTLQELAERVGSRADVWVRLARAKQATLAPAAEVRDALVRALAVAEPGDPARKQALLGLADLDLASGEGARAELWLERAQAADALAGRREETSAASVPSALVATAAGSEASVTTASSPAFAGAPSPAFGKTSADVALRRAEARLIQGDAAGAQEWLGTFESESTDARAALARGRAAAMLGDGRAYVHLVRAWLLDAPGASEVTSSALAYVPSNQEVRARIKAIAEARGEASLARWRAAFARAEGHRDEARAALNEAVLAGESSAAGPLLDAALEDRDVARLQAALALLARADTRSVAAPLNAALEGEVEGARKLADALADTEDTAKLDDLAAIVHPRALPWARELRDQLLDAWIPAATLGSTPATLWPALLARLDTHARALHDVAVSADLATLAALGSQPIRLAIVGEFNAGKSTFINALLGADVAPTGVLPTTATLHHLRYAQDPIARIQLGTGAGKARERIVPLGELRAVLKAMGGEGEIDRVDIFAPLPFLTRVEILDTPGFNAPDARHAEAARRAFAEADVIVWLLDGAQAMKASERAILDEARRAGLPIQFLVNKADRLTPSDLTKVMDLVTGALADARLRSWSPPQAALGAPRARGKARRRGGAGGVALARGAGARSTRELVARSDELKELSAAAARAGHRRSTGDPRHRPRARRGHRARDRRLHAHGACLLAAAALDRDAGSTVRDVADAIAEAESTWRSEIAVVATGRGRDRGSDDGTATAARRWERSPATASTARSPTWRRRWPRR